MSKCENCYYNTVCWYKTTYGSVKTEEGCFKFKAKSLVVELPCAIGDEVYYLGGIKSDIIKPLRIEQIYIGECGFSFRVCTQNNIYIDVDEEEIFYTKEQAEAKLKEINND